uniref:Secreted protein n=1 Tax=Steinernema glaseri TaxID=37863 RepID=A0A1I8A0W6_9BILA
MLCHQRSERWLSHVLLSVSRVTIRQSLSGCGSVNWRIVETTSQVQRQALISDGTQIALPDAASQDRFRCAEVVCSDAETLCNFRMCVEIRSSGFQDFTKTAVRKKSIKRLAKASTLPAVSTINFRARRIRELVLASFSCSPQALCFYLGIEHAPRVPSAASASRNRSCNFASVRSF